MAKRKTQSDLRKAADLLDWMNRKGASEESVTAMRRSLERRIHLPKFLLLTVNGARMRRHYDIDSHGRRIYYRIEAA